MMKNQFIITILLTITFGDISAQLTFQTASQKKRSRIVEAARYAPKQARIQAISQCGAWRFYFCMRALMGNLKNADIDIKIASIRNLGVLRSKGAVQALLAVLEQPMEEVDPKTPLNSEKKEKRKKDKIRIQIAILISLGYVNEPTTLKDIEKYLSNENDSLRRASANALGVIKNKDSIAPLKSQLEVEKKARVQVEILKSLIIISKSIEYQKQLFAHLKDKDNWVRYHVADALIDLRLKTAVPRLEEALRYEDDEWVRERLTKAYHTSLYLP